MKKDKVIFYLSAVMFLISNMVVFFIQFASFDTDSKSKIIAYILGGTFWLFLISGILMQFVLTGLRKRKNKNTRSKLFLLRYFRNKVAIIFDLTLFLSIIGNIFFMILKTYNEWLQIVLVFSLIFSFEMHWVFNSENYKYIKNNKEDIGNE